jgi:hypothetical protein
LRWWSENSTNTAIYGNGSYKINADSDKRWNNPSEIEQIDLTRSYKNVQGNAFDAKSFVNKNQSVTKLLSENQYKYPALPTVVLII